MRVATVHTIHCPRCNAPAKGDYKYCPECACRLRPGIQPPEPPIVGGIRGKIVLGLIALGLLAAGTFVGYQVLGEREIVQTPAGDPTTFLTIEDLPEQLETIPEGVAVWQEQTVWVAPPEDVADTRVLQTFRQGEVERFAERVARAPSALSRWSRLVRILYAHTREVMAEKTRHVPVRTRPFRMMGNEVTRGQWAEFLRDVERDPSPLLSKPWIRQLWRPEGRPGWAVDYRRDWWNGVETQVRHRLALEAHVPADDLPPDGEDGMSPPDGEDDAAEERGPPVPVIPVPAFVEAEDLGTISNADAVKLLYPASWVRLDAGGAIYWVLEPGSEDLPVTDISWYDAQAFVEWARSRLGLPSLRVPTWAEWARAYHGNHPHRPEDDFMDQEDVGWKWPWGNEIDRHGCNNLNYARNEPIPQLRHVRSTYGWHDGDTVDGVLNMAGNAAEWTRGSFHLRAPSGEIYVLRDDPKESETDRAFVCGGSYLDGLDDCSINGRVSLRKTERRIDVGFRLILDVGL